MFRDYQYQHELYSDVYVIIGLTSSALVPLFGYFLFLIYYFFLDLAKAILATPNKIESLIPYQKYMIKQLKK
jgi:hypothetical protein